MHVCENFNNLYDITFSRLHGMLTRIGSKKIKFVANGICMFFEKHLYEKIETLLNA